MSKTFRPYEPDQAFLMPASLREWLPKGHLAYFVSELVDQLDLSDIMSRYEEERGYPPYHPVMMVKVLLYAYCIGVPSSRKIAKRLEEDIGFRVLAANNTPDFRTISDFRKDHLQNLAGLFVQVLKMCRRAGMVKLGHVAIDGTKVKANASKHKAMSYKRMKEEEARLEAEVRELLQKAQSEDEAEDRLYGKNKRGDELPKELAFRESRLKKIREAKAALEADAQAQAEAQEGKNKPGKGTGVPEDKAQRNFTDPESGIMPVSGGKNFEQCYNAQAAVDSARQVITAADVTQRPSDKEQAVPMVKQVEENLGELPGQLSADAGYFSSKVVEELTAAGIDVYIPPDKMRHAYKAPPAPRGRIPKGLSTADRMRRKLRTKQGRKRYGLRKELPEPVFGQIKQARGFRQFLLRGKEKVRGEWRFICTGHNVLKLFRAMTTGLAGPSTAAPSSLLPAV
jgi:transposase